MKQNQNKVTEVKKVAAEKKNVPKISKAEIRESLHLTSSAEKIENAVAAS